MKPLLLGKFVTAPAYGQLAATPYGRLHTYDLADFLARWPELHEEALALLGDKRIHPTAYVHPQAIVGDDVIIGPDVKVHEFSTVRKGSVLCAGASVGFNCEVTSAFVGEGAVLGHRIGIKRTIVGNRAHLSAGVTVAAIAVSADMSAPDREIRLRTEGGAYRCRTTQFGAVIGDKVQTGNNISLGPGILVGRSSQIDSGVTLAIRAVPENTVVTAPHTAQTRIRSRNAGVEEMLP
ncbi:transferase [Streptomyces anulatus]|uniref:transferase n=1 Tax=Streptomyces anulatus TaxID=1892 RepID=UPI00067E550D|nr:transferase [Streptomyces anulatus]KND25560.1 transferase [Streptomyces europaeiscabiei]WSR80144.1 transferase [Streptomyces anulatus]